MWGFYLSRTICNIVGNIYPAYASYIAVLSGKPEQHKQWLTYWIVNTFFTVFEMLGDPLISWLPLYWEAKIGLVLWLSLYGGAGILYNRVLRILLERYEHVIDSHVSSLQNRAAEKVNDVAQQGLKHVRSKSSQIATMGLQWLTTVNAVGSGAVPLISPPNASSAAAAAAAAAASDGGAAGTAGNGAAGKGDRKKA